MDGQVKLHLWWRLVHVKMVWPNLDFTALAHSWICGLVPKSECSRLSRSTVHPVLKRAQTLCADFPTWGSNFMRLRLENYLQFTAIWKNLPVRRHNGLDSANVTFKWKSVLFAKNPGFCCVVQTAGSRYGIELARGLLMSLLWEAWHMVVGGLWLGRNSANSVHFTDGRWNVQRYRDVICPAIISCCWVCVVICRNRRTE